MNKRHIIISIVAGNYFIQFMQANGKENNSWDYYALHDADNEICEWLADDSKVPDK